MDSTLLVLADDRRSSLAWFGSFGRMEIANNFSFQDPTGKGNEKSEIYIPDGIDWAEKQQSGK